MYFSNGMSMIVLGNGSRCKYDKQCSNVNTILVTVGYNFHNNYLIIIYLFVE